MLRAEGLRKSFGALTVTDGVSLDANLGVRHAIIGPNGAGKSTLFALLAGELAPSAGTILLDDRDITRLPPHARVQAGLAWSYQKNTLFAGETVLFNLQLADIARRGYGYAFWRRLSRERRARDKAGAVAERVGLADLLDRPVNALSYGACRQLEIGLALMADPKVLLLDEPTSGMSPEETGRMLELIHDLPREMAVLVIEHDMDLVFSVADRITVLNYGKVLLSGPPEEVRGSRVVQETYLGHAPGLGREPATNPGLP